MQPALAMHVAQSVTALQFDWDLAIPNANAAIAKTLKSWQATVLVMPIELLRIW